MVTNAHSRVLIADDHSAIRRVVRSVLSSQNIDVCAEAQDGQEAVSKAKQFHPELILLDAAMPVKNGIQAAREIKKALPAAKIIVFSVDFYTEVHAPEQGGADAFISKASGSELVSAIQRLLGDHVH